MWVSRSIQVFRILISISCSLNLVSSHVFCYRTSPVDGWMDGNFQNPLEGLKCNIQTFSCYPRLCRKYVVALFMSVIIINKAGSANASCCSHILHLQITIEVHVKNYVMSNCLLVNILFFKTEVLFRVCLQYVYSMSTVHTDSTELHCKRLERTLRPSCLKNSPDLLCVLQPHPPTPPPKMAAGSQNNTHVPGFS